MVSASKVEEGMESVDGLGACKASQCQMGLNWQDGKARKGGKAAKPTGILRLRQTRVVESKLLE
jgi:hypothetical protein